MVVGETGVIGAHVVYGVGLGPVSGGGNTTIYPQAPVVNLVRDLLSQTSLVTRDFVLVCILTKLTILKEMFKRGLNCKTA